MLMITNSMKEDEAAVMRVDPFCVTLDGFSNFSMSDHLTASCANPHKDLEPVSCLISHRPMCPGSG